MIHRQAELRAKIVPWFHIKTDMTIRCLIKNTFEDPHREDTPSKKTEALTKSMSNKYIKSNIYKRFL